MRHLSLTRTEAEWLVALLEDCNPKTVGTWRHDLADEIRYEFGMGELSEFITSDATARRRLSSSRDSRLIHLAVQFSKFHLNDAGVIGEKARELDEIINKQWANFKPVSDNLTTADADADRVYDAREKLS